MSLTGDGTTLLFTDFLGGIDTNASKTSAQALTVDGVGVIYVTGSTTATFTSGDPNHGDFLSGNATEDSSQYRGLSNVFFGEIDPTGAYLLEATLAGSPGTDMANSLTISRPLDSAGVVSIVGATVINPPGFFDSASISQVDPVNPPGPNKTNGSDTTGFFAQEALAGYCKMALVGQAGTSLTFRGPCVSGTQGGTLFVTPSNPLLTKPIVVSASGTTLSGTVTVDVSSLQGQALNFSFGFLPLGAIGGTGICQNNGTSISGCSIFTSGGGAGTIFTVTAGTLSVTLSCVGNCTYFNTPNTVLIGQPITLNAAVTNGIPNTVKWSSSGGTFSDPNSSTSVTFTPGGTGGQIVVTATPDADPSFSPKPTITLNTLEPTNVSFPDAGPFTFGQTNITVDVSAGMGSASVPNGDVVTYQVVGGPSGSSTLINGAASIPLASLPVGTYNLVVNYPGNAASHLANSSNTLTFTVNQAPPNVTLSLSASSIFFGNIVQGTPSGTQLITLTNSGANTVSGLTLKLGGANASEFALTSATTCGASLAANSSCSIAATFTPASLGTRSAVLVISYTGIGSPQVVNLGGIGVAPLSVTSNATQFVAGTTFQFTSSAPATWTASAGTITSAGFFTAPSPVTTPTPITVTATSQSNAQIIATTQITVFPAPAIVVPSTNTLPAGGSVNIPMSISAGTGIAGEAMAFVCAPKTLPTGVSCFFTPNPVVNAGGATLTLQLFSNNARNNLPMRDYPWRKLPVDGYAVIAVGSILVFGRKKYGGRLILILAITVGSTALLSLTACGTSGTFNGTTQEGHVTGTYTINISVSGASPGSADYNQTLTTVPLKVVLQ
jgi:hypothetical protein